MLSERGTNKNPCFRDISFSFDVHGSNSFNVYLACSLDYILKCNLVDGLGNVKYVLYKFLPHVSAVA